MKGTIRHHWEEVGRASGQPFSFEFFELKYCPMIIVNEVP